MKYGLASGCLWALDTTILAIALSMAPFIDTVEAIAFASIVSAALHDVFCAIWMFFYMALRGRLKDTVAALKTRSGKVVMLGALLGGPIGMSGYVIAINNIGPAYTAMISAFYPAFGALMAMLFLKEKMELKQFIALLVALGGICIMGAITITNDQYGDPVLGLVCALLCVVGWGSEAVICAWGMRDEAVDNETALQIRETTSGLVYLVVVLPIFGAWAFTLGAIPTIGTAVVALSALAGTASYLFYYKGISVIGAAKGMALNITYSAWAVVFGFVLLGTVPGWVEIVCCLLIMGGTILAASDWKELFSRKKNLPKDPHGGLMESEG
ncbi:DMT family transporter [Anaerotardibacter muris]|uniref:DMT family transporter n=1 Tax=Anaerotardibacter muris TaxID=2941505 RepID=UPI00203C7E03|nr:DMT family transporter [Anaerotardibacter muris]